VQATPARPYPGERRLGRFRPSLGTRLGALAAELNGRIERPVRQLHRSVPPNIPSTRRRRQSRNREVFALQQCILEAAQTAVWTRLH